MDGRTGAISQVLSSFGGCKGQVKFNLAHLTRKIDLECKRREDHTARISPSVKRCVWLSAANRAARDRDRVLASTTTVKSPALTVTRYSNVASLQTPESSFISSERLQFAIDHGQNQERASASENSMIFEASAKLPGEGLHMDLDTDTESTRQRRLLERDYEPLPELVPPIHRRKLLELRIPFRRTAGAVNAGVSSCPPHF
jgi:hypothetical protein